MKRTLSGLLIGIPVTFFIFVFMSLLVQAKVVISPPSSPLNPQIDKVQTEEPTTIKIRPKVPEMDPVRELPTSTEPAIENLTKGTKALPHFGEDGRPSFPAENGGHSTRTILQQVEKNSEAIPIIIVEPKWPRNADFGGSVRLCFNIMVDGSATNITVVESNPGRTFAQEAKRAVRKWKFRPSYVNNVAVEQQNMCYTLEFELND